MRTDQLMAHLSLQSISRRDAMRLAAKAGIAGAVVHATAGAIGLGGAGAAPATAQGTDMPERRAGQPVPPDDFDDTLFDVAAVMAGAWDNTAFYMRGDQRGTFQEVTPDKTAEALDLLDRRRPVTTYNLGELMFNGFPAFATSPPRLYNQTLTVLGYAPPPNFAGVLQSASPLGPNRVSIHEERFRTTAASAPFSNTYQIGTQLDNLNHVGVGPVFYGGHRGPAMAQTWGTTALGAEHMGPIVTRGVLLDVLTLKLAESPTDPTVIDHASNGKPHLAASYRITLEDLQAAMRAGGIRRIKAGDVVLIRTGWNQLVNPKDPVGHSPDDPEHPNHGDHVKYLATEPGIHLRETHWLASHRPALIGSDTWGLEVVPSPPPSTSLFPCHQELLAHYGIRIGEGIVTDELAADGVLEFVYAVTPQFALGATAGNTPPMAMGQPRRR
jgi:kynurenine formamidase